MAMRVVGAGLGRTGTNSLKLALERLLGGRCYHMVEVTGRPQDVPLWEEAVAGRPVDWNALFADFSATVDWPSASFWREIHGAFPESVVLLSTRESPQAWWGSVEKTIVQAISTVPEDEQLARQRAMVNALLRTRLTDRWPAAEAVMEAYERHNEEVRSTVPAERLIEWQPGAGWGPLCERLGLAVPDEPFPHVNTTAEFRLATGIEQ